MRKFHNVGEALFVVEKIDKYNFVYDCGGQGISSVENAIKNAFEKDEKIEAVFISHYDADHINGLHFLLQYCKVKRLILPMMTDTIKFILLFLQVYEGNMQDFIINPEEYVRKISQETKVVFIADARRDDLYSRGQSERSFDELSQLMPGKNIIRSGMNLISDKLLGWVFIPMCIQVLSLKQENDFIVELYKLMDMSPPKGKVDIIRLWEDYNLCGAEKTGTKASMAIRNKIKKAIQTIDPNLDDEGINAASQTLYSGPCKTNKSERIGCLYLGDFNAQTNWDKLDSVYGIYQKNIGIVQVPHHGSNACFSDKLINLDTIAIISVKIGGRINIDKTINEIVKKGGIPLITGSRGDIVVECSYYGAIIIRPNRILFV